MEQQPEIITSVKYFSGLDIGQARDFSTLAVLEKTIRRYANNTTQGTNRPPLPAEYAVRHLVRWKLGTPYSETAADLVPLFARAPLPGSVLAIDQTGVGRPVVEMIRKAKPDAKFYPINITAGHEVSRDSRSGAYNVPKKDLVGVMQVLLENGRLKVAPGLEEAATLKKELFDFQMKITAAANETFGAVGDSKHDDLVMAVAMAAWAGEKIPTEFPVAGGPMAVSGAIPLGNFGWPRY